MAQLSLDNETDDPAQQTLRLLFTNGSRLEADYWRLIKSGKADISSFDHRQKYGLPQPIDAFRQLREEINDLPVTDVRLEAETGDLIFQFGETVKLQVLNFSCYEVWHISFSDGTGEYSNYAK